MAEVYKIEAWQNGACPHGAIRLYWDSPEGFGQYDLIIEDEARLFGYSEYMDSNENKDFLRSLFESIIAMVEIAE